MFPHRGLFLIAVVTFFFFDFFVICSDPAAPVEEFQIPVDLQLPPPAPTWQTVINTGCKYNSVS